MKRTTRTKKGITGRSDHCDREFWFKIDYFYLELEMASPDPADPTITKRIMAIGLAQD